MPDLRLPENVRATPYLPPRLPALEARINYIRDFLIPSKLFFPCQINILIVTDDSGSFDETAPFGLGHFLKVFTHDPANAVTDNPAPYTRFSVKTAHRNGGVADFTNFQFDTHDLTQYDQIWLFGVARTNLPLPDAELRAIATFMNEGGGVFATGDHEDLGVGLCGSMPRLRCMRRWWYTSADPLGSPPAPGASGNNHNTITDNPATVTNEARIDLFQSDNYPQNISPRYRRVWSGPFARRRVFPHPVLCGPNGVIKVLPDHQHEGKCDIYNDFSRTLNFAGYSFKEFPNTTGSSTEQLPTVIADNLNQITNLQFESITVYDGHQTDAAGRILCDATWHHFFNINLLGFEASRARIRSGMISAEDVRAENDYVNIRAYYRNIAYWIAGRNNQVCLRRKGYHLLIHDFDFKIAYKPLHLITDKIAFMYYWGELAKDSLNQFAPQCQWYEWIIWILRDTYLYRRLSPLDENIKELPDVEKWPDIEKIHTVLLGEAAYSLYEYVFEQKGFSEKSYQQFDEVLQKGLPELLKEVFNEIKDEMKRLEEKLKIG